jgi:hypothetical protein
MVTDFRLHCILLTCSMLAAATFSGCIIKITEEGSDRGAERGDGGPDTGADAGETPDAATGGGGTAGGAAGSSGGQAGYGGQAGAGAAGSSASGAGGSSGSGSGAGGSSASGSGGQDAGPDAFVPGPAEAIAVNSGSTAMYALNDGEWKLFYFDAEAGQTYTVSPLSGIVRGYVSTSADVSPASYQYATDEVEGTVSFVAAETARHYIAVAVSGGGASGSFQVADGGRLLALGGNTVTLDAPNAEDNWFFHFPATAGAGYAVQVQGPATPAVVLSVAPRPERSTDDLFLYPAWSMSGNLPLSDTIAAPYVSQSTSGFYYLSLKVFAAMNVTITLTQQ